MAGASPTQRSLKMLRDLGYRAAVVEQSITANKPGGRRCLHCGSAEKMVFKRDAFGVCDILAYSPALGETIMIQTTTGGNITNRKFKIHIEPDITAAVREWVQIDNRFFIHGWRKLGRFWKCRVLEAYAKDDGSIQWQEYGDEEWVDKVA